MAEGLLILSAVIARLENVSLAITSGGWPRRVQIRAGAGWSRAGAAAARWWLFAPSSLALQPVGIGPP
jgi:hypothetical protein